jgi:hypothetical protein
VFNKILVLLTAEQEEHADQEYLRSFVMSFNHPLRLSGITVSLRGKEWHILLKLLSLPVRVLLAPLSPLHHK